MVVSGQFNCTKDTGSMPFLLSVLLSFQGYSHLFGVGSFSKSIVFTKDDIDVLLESKYGKAETLTVLMLLYPSLDFNNKFHVDHMYPKSKFTQKRLLKKGVPSTSINEYMASVNNIANLQLLAAIPNIEKQNEDFNIWFEKTYVTEADRIQYRTIHYIPEMEYTYDNFMIFVSKRQDLLRKKLEQLLL